MSSKSDDITTEVADWLLDAANRAETDAARTTVRQLSAHFNRASADLRTRASGALISPADHERQLADLALRVMDEATIAAMPAALRRFLDQAQVSPAEYARSKRVMPR